VLVEKNFIAQTPAMFTNSPPHQAACARDKYLQIVCTCAPYWLR